MSSDYINYHEDRFDDDNYDAYREEVLRREAEKEGKISKIHALVFAIVVVLFVIVFLIVKGFSWENVLIAGGICLVVFELIVELIVALFAIPSLTVFYYANRNDWSKNKEKNCGWVSPLFSAIFFVLLYDIAYGLYWIALAILKSAGLEVFEFMKPLPSLLISFMVLVILVLTGCFYIKKHPNVSIKDFGL